MPLPFGGKVRQIMVDIDPHALQAKGLAPLDVVNAINAQNLILPGGTAKIGAREYNVQMNGSTDSIAALNNLPVKTVDGGVVYVRDVAHVRDGYANAPMTSGDPKRCTVTSTFQYGTIATPIMSSVSARNISGLLSTSPAQEWPTTSSLCLGTTTPAISDACAISTRPC